MILFFVCCYIIVSACIGLYVATKVKNTRDFAIAGRRLPLPVVIATVFATWFGAEAIFGISSTFVNEGLNGLAADPFGASMCLILAGFLFSKYLYHQNFITLGDFYRRRFDRKIEFLTSIAILISYLGWVGAQIKALGLIINVLSNNQVSEELGMVLGTFVVVSYTSLGGMLSVAILDFIQMIVVITGLLIIAYTVAEMTGGVYVVIEHAREANKLNFWPTGDIFNWISFFGVWITLMLGSIPQQDVFQRITSAKTAKIAFWGSLFGALIYFIFTFVPIFIAYSAILIDPEFFQSIIDFDAQFVLPEFIIKYTHPVIQIIFFGAVISAIMSCSSATLLAPSITFAENVIKPFKPNISDEEFLKIMRLCLIVFSVIVLIYALLSSQTIFGMVESAYKVTLAGAFTPLIFGIFWKKANHYGAFASIVIGILSWVILEILYGESILIPAQLVGLLLSILAMISISISTNKLVLASRAIKA
jgi:SSS family solute:Na+ symporter